VPAGFVVTGQQVIVDVGGVVRPFTLDAKGKSPRDTQASFQLKVKQKKGVVAAQTSKFLAKFAKSDFAANFTDEALDDTTVKNEQTTVPVVLFFNMQKFSADVAQLYNAKQGSTGKTKNP
jgi:hypothetical protein